MNDWIQFRREVVDVPEVKVKKQKDRSFNIICDSDDCVYVDNAPSESDADELKAYHEQWHENGMPQ